MGYLVCKNKDQLIKIVIKKKPFENRKAFAAKYHVRESNPSFLREREAS